MSPVSDRQSSTRAVNTRVCAWIAIALYEYWATLDTHSLPTTNAGLAIEDVRAIADVLRGNNVVERLMLAGA